MTQDMNKNMALYNEVTAHPQRDYGSLSTRLRLVGIEITARCHTLAILLSKLRSSLGAG